MTKNLKSRLLAVSTAAALFSGILAPIALAQDARDAITARKALMSYVGASMKSMGGMAGGKTDFNAGQVNATANALSAIAVAFPVLFPEGSGTGGKTTASAAAFTDRQGLQKGMATLGAAATQLAAATNLAEMQAATRALGGTCRACHTRYRN